MRITRHLLSSARGGLASLLLLSAATLLPAAEPFFFIQLTDPQLGMYTRNADFAHDAANLEFAVAHVNRLRPAFVLVTGDLVHREGDAAQIAAYRRIMGKVDPSIPVYHLPGNHDVGNTPTPATLAAYTRDFGPDRFVFRHGDFVGVVLNSVLIHSPQEAGEAPAEQERWLRSELEKARASGARPIVVFQHHPIFLKQPDEKDEYFNLPLARRAKLLALFREFGVRYVFCGHYHRNAEARDGEIEVITTGPVGKPLGEGKSGFRLAVVRDQKIEHRYVDFGDVPTQVDPKVPLNPPARK